MQSEVNSRVSYTDCGNMSKPSSRSAYKLYSRPHLITTLEYWGHRVSLCDTYDVLFPYERV